MQWLNEPFFDDLRTKQQLGYVVFSRGFNSRDVCGCQFLVQSSHKSCEYLVEAINNFLVDTREKIKLVTGEELEVQKQAVITKLAEKDINLARENGRYFNEIATHEYLFNRQDVEVETVKSISLEEFKNHFEFVFFSDEVKRFDLELTSTAHEEQQKEYLEKNKEHSIFKDTFKSREVVTDLNEFKASAEWHQNRYKNNFVSFRN